MHLTRRTFMAGAAALAAAGVVGAAEPGAPAIIDTHIHVWDLQTLNPPWLANAGPVLRQRYMAEEYHKATEGLNITRAVYVEIGERPERQVAEAEFVLELIGAKRTPLVAAVIGADPAAEGFAQTMQRFAAVPAVKGIRYFFRKGLDAEPKFVEGIRLLGQLGLSFDLVLGAELLEGAVKLVDACPNVTFILDHCAYGNPDWYDPTMTKDSTTLARREMWENGIAALAGRRNVACKISGVAEQTRGPVDAHRLAPIVERCLDRFGEDRILFGSNWPVCLRSISLAAWYRALEQITAARSKAFRQKLFHDNAVRWYRLEAR